MWLQFFETHAHFLSGNHRWQRICTSTRRLLRCCPSLSSLDAPQRPNNKTRSIQQIRIFIRCRSAIPQPRDQFHAPRLPIIRLSFLHIYIPCDCIQFGSSCFRVSHPDLPNFQKSCFAVPGSPKTSESPFFHTRMSPISKDSDFPYPDLPNLQES